MKKFLIIICCTIIVASAEDAKMGPENLKLKGNEVTEDADVSCVCPADPILETEECVLSVMKKRFIKNVWANFATKLEGEQVQMKNIVLKMIETDLPLWRHTAFVNNVWLASYLHSVSDTPSLCAFAQMINASLAWETTKDEKAISEALDEIAVTLHNYVMASGDIAIKAAGCSVSSPHKFRNHTCHENGLVYNIDETWKISGGMMPNAYEKAAKALYSSTSYTDRLMAVMATGSITQSLQEVANNFETELVSQFLHLANTSPIPSCCCSGFIEKLNKSYELFEIESLKITNAIKEKYLSTLSNTINWMVT